MSGRSGFSRREALALGVGGLALAAQPAWALQGSPDPLDSIVQRFLTEFGIPGVGIALIRRGEPVFTRGYGIRTLGRPQRVDSDTLFAIASNSKSFVAASIAMLVEEGKLAWDQPVVRYMPDFQMSDPQATQMMTVRDLLVHRSGLALGAGDLMQFPQSDHTRAEIFRALRHLPLARGFRSGYAYDNILYLVAGMLIERMSGQRYEDFVTTRLLRPLGMTNSVPNRPLVRSANVVGRHARLGPPLRGFGALERVEPDESTEMAAAGGVHASVRDIVPWLQTQLARGVAPSGTRLWSEAQANEMWTPQVITSVGPGPTPEVPSRSVLAGYALGWFVQEYRDRRLIHHSGGLSGQITYTGFFPDHGSAFAVFTNTEDPAVGGLRNAVIDYLLDVPEFDWVTSTRTRLETQRTQALAAAGGDVNRAPAGGPSLPLAAYAGRYRDPWYGDIVVSQRRGGLHIDFTRTPVFKSMLEPFGPDAFRTRFARGVGEDAVVTFVVENGAVPRMRLRALSPFADFSYDFHDLNPVRVE